MDCFISSIATPPGLDELESEPALPRPEGVSADVCEQQSMLLACAASAVQHKNEKYRRLVLMAASILQQLAIQESYWALKQLLSYWRESVVRSCISFDLVAPFNLPCGHCSFSDDELLQTVCSSSGIRTCPLCREEYPHVVLKLPRNRGRAKRWKNFKESSPSQQKLGFRKWWDEHLDDKGRVYFKHHPTKTSYWQPPINPEAQAYFEIWCAQVATGEDAEVKTTLNQRALEFANKKFL